MKITEIDIAYPDDVILRPDGSIIMAKSMLETTYFEFMKQGVPYFLLPAQQPLDSQTQEAITTFLNEKNIRYFVHALLDSIKHELSQSETVPQAEVTHALMAMFWPNLDSSHDAKKTKFAYAMTRLIVKRDLVQLEKKMFEFFLKRAKAISTSNLFENINGIRKQNTRLPEQDKEKVAILLRDIKRSDYLALALGWAKARGKTLLHLYDRANESHMPTGGYIAQKPGNKMAYIGMALPSAQQHILDITSKDEFNPRHFLFHVTFNNRETLMRGNRFDLTHRIENQYKGISGRSTIVSTVTEELMHLSCSDYWPVSDLKDFYKSIEQLGQHLLGLKNLFDCVISGLSLPKGEAAQWSIIKPMLQVYAESFQQCQVIIRGARDSSARYQVGEEIIDSSGVFKNCRISDIIMGGPHDKDKMAIGLVLDVTFSDSSSDKFIAAFARQLVDNILHALSLKVYYSPSEQPGEIIAGLAEFLIHKPTADILFPLNFIKYYLKMNQMIELGQKNPMPKFQNGIESQRLKLILNKLAAQEKENPVIKEALKSPQSAEATKSTEVVNLKPMPYANQPLASTTVFFTKSSTMLAPPSSTDQRYSADRSSFNANCLMLSAIPVIGLLLIVAMLWKYYSSKPVIDKDLPGKSMSFRS